MLAEKASCAATTKEQRVEIEKSIEELRQEQIRAAQDKKEAVKRSQAEGEQKVHQHRKERLLMVRPGCCVFQTAMSTRLSCFHMCVGGLGDVRLSAV